MFCTGCGKKLDDDALFCTGCGRRVKTNNQPAPTPIRPEQPKPAEQPKPVEQPKPIEAPKVEPRHRAESPNTAPAKNKSMTPIVIGIAAVAAIGIGIGAAVFSGGKAEEQKNASKPAEVTTTVQETETKIVKDTELEEVNDLEQSVASVSETGTMTPSGILLLNSLDEWEELKENAYSGNESAFNSEAYKDNLRFVDPYNLMVKACVGLLSDVYQPEGIQKFAFYLDTLAGKRPYLAVSKDGNSVEYYKVLGYRKNDLAPIMVLGAPFDGDADGKGLYIDDLFDADEAYNNGFNNLRYDEEFAAHCWMDTTKPSRFGSEAVTESVNHEDTGNSGLISIENSGNAEGGVLEYNSADYNGLATRGNIQNVSEYCDEIDGLITTLPGAADPEVILGGQVAKRTVSTGNRLIDPVMKKVGYSSYSIEYYYPPSNSAEGLANRPMKAVCIIDGRNYTYYYAYDQLIRRVGPEGVSNNIETNEFLKDLYRIGTYYQSTNAY